MKTTVYILISLFLVSCSGSENMDTPVNEDANIGIQIPVNTNSQLGVAIDDGSSSVDEGTELPY